MKHWLFQGNPDVFDVDSYVRTSNEFTWHVGQKHFAKDMQPGDQVFIWRASGKKKLEAGVVAEGVLIGDCRAVS